MWTAHLNGVPKRVDNTAVSINGKVYSFDFQNARTSPFSRELIDVYVFDPASYRWEVVQTQALRDGEPTGIYRHTIVAYGHCAYLWGGWLRGMSPNKLYRFDTRTMKWSRPKVFGKAPTAVCSHSACVLGHRMYIFADILFGDSSKRAWFLDLETMKWHPVPISAEAPAERCFHTVSAIGNRMYLWGGCVEDDSHASGFVCDDNIYYLETTTSTWVRPHVEGVRPVGRQEHSSFVYNGELYVFGGYNHMLGIYFADMYKYDPDMSCWTEVKPLGSGPSARYSHGCCTIGEKVFIFRGLGPVANRGKELLTDLHVLHFAPTLKNLCVLAIIDAGLDQRPLPPIIRKEIDAIIPSQL